MDYETMKDCFVAVFENYNTTEQHIFVVSKVANNYLGFNDFIEFLNKNIENQERHISFNGLGFDAQVTESILENAFNWSGYSNEKITSKIYKIAQTVISLSNAGEFLPFYEGKMRIPQLDVFKLNHWDNAAKRSSLKWIQFMIDWHNLEDMPMEHYEEVNTIEELDMIVNYCINDVKSTKQILRLCKDQIALRKQLTDTYNLNLMSASEPKISKELFLYYLTQDGKHRKNDIKYSKTKRNEIIVKDLILPYIEFEHPEFVKLHNKFKDLIIDPEYTKGAFKESINYNGVITDFGLGGLHGARQSGVYESDEEMIIVSSDVVSFYPNMAIRNQWAPAHLPKTKFCNQYEWFFNERKKIPKSNPINYVFKIILNSTYGLSNDKYSYFYDPQMTMQITVNGQLSLMLLYEMIVQNIPGSIPLMQNTDGLETMIPRKYKDQYFKICKQWEEKTKLKLEHDYYQKLIIADVNTYIAVHDYKEIDDKDYWKIKNENPHYLYKQENGKSYYAPTKCKGRFAWESFTKYDVSTLHKNKSSLIVSKAIYNFFVHNISPEKTLAENRNIYDYCNAVRIKGTWKFTKVFVENSEYKEEDLSKTVRYYISKKGCKILKKHKSDGRITQVEAGKWLCTLFNKYEKKDWKDYNIDETYYLKAIYKEIDNIAQSRFKQLYLF